MMTLAILNVQLKAVRQLVKDMAEVHPDATELCEARENLLRLEEQFEFFEADKPLAIPEVSNFTERAGRIVALYETLFDCDSSEVLKVVLR